MTKNILNATMALTLLAIVTQTASALPTGAPDATSSSLLLTMAFGGMMVVRRFIRR